MRRTSTWWLPRGLCCLAVSLCLSGSAWAQSCLLVEAPLAKSSYRIELTMELTGKVRVQQEGKTLTLAQKATAKHTFLERLLEAGDLAERSARRYQTAEASIQVENDTVHRRLRPERALVVVQRKRGHAVAYCPHGLLTQEEMEMTEHLDTLALPGLLPGKETSVGTTWKIGNQAVQSLCNLDGLLQNDLTGKLESIQGDLATGSVQGIVKGIDMGAQVSSEINARFDFDLKEKRLVRLTWKQSDERTQGPVSPGMSLDVTYALQRTPILEPNELNDIALVPALAVAADKMLPLRYRDSQGRFEFQHQREWHLVGQQDQQLVYRLLSERGDFVAQVTFTPYRKEKPGTMMSVDEFAVLMASAPGWEQEGTLLEKKDNVDVSGGIKAYRVGAAGKLDGVAVVQYFHLLTGPRGDQLIVTFTMRPEQVDQLQLRDLTLIQSITFPEAKNAE